jgi:methylenetetrahydrofolate reductase (NADPH)
MHIQDVFAQHKTTFSFEFFPPKDDKAAEALFAQVAELEALKPSFVSVTRSEEHTELNPLFNLKPGLL